MVDMLHEKGDPCTVELRGSDATLESLMGHVGTRFLNAGERVRMIGYFEGAGKRGVFGKSGKSAVQCMVVNLTQNPEYFGTGPAEIMPALLRNTKLYDLASCTEVIPQVHWLIQGWPYPGLAPPEQAGTFPFAGMAEDVLTNRDVRILTGNGMHLAQVGTSCLFALATAVGVKLDI